MEIIFRIPDSWTTNEAHTLVGSICMGTNTTEIVWMERNP